MNFWTKWQWQAGGWVGGFGLGSRRADWSLVADMGYWQSWRHPWRALGQKLYVGESSETQFFLLKLLVWKQNWPKQTGASLVADMGNRQSWRGSTATSYHCNGQKYISINRQYHDNSEESYFRRFFSNATATGIILSNKIRAMYSKQFTKKSFFFPLPFLFLFRCPTISKD